MRYAPLMYYEDVLEASRNTLMARNAREICKTQIKLYTESVRYVPISRCGYL